MSAQPRDIVPTPGPTTGPPTHGDHTRRIRPHHYVLAFILTAAAALRLWSATSVSYINSDEAATATMVRNIVRGTHAYVYYPGQAYNGSFEQYFQAAFFWIFRVHITFFTMRIPLIFLSTAAVWAVYFLGKSLGGTWLGIVSASVMAAGPYYNILYGTRSFGAYDSVQLLVVGIVITALKLWDHRFSSGRVGQRHIGILAGLLGLECGLVFWLNWVGGSVCVVAVLWAVPVFRRHLRSLAFFAGGGIIGAFPALIWMAAHHGFPHLGWWGTSSVWSRVSLFFDKIAGKFLGFGGQHGASGAADVVAKIVVVLVAVLWVIAIIHARGDIFSTFTFSMSSRSRWVVLLLILPIFFATYVANSMSGLDLTGRIPLFPDQSHYVFVLYPFAAVSVGALGMWVGKHARHIVMVPTRWPLLPRLAALVCVFTAISLATINEGRQEDRELANGGYTTTSELDTAITAAKAHGITRILADYWTANVADFVGQDEGVRVAALYTAKHNPDAYAAIQSAPVVAFMEASLGYPKQVRQLLVENHATYKTLNFPGSITVYYDVSPQLRPVNNW